MGKKRILILGAGLAGLSAAWHLQEKGRDYLIFEKESDVGGLSRSKIINGFTFDYCGHLLHFKHQYTFNLIKKLLGNNLLKHQRSAWVYSQGRYSRYPFQVNLYGLPPPIIKECLLGFIRASGDGKLKKDKNLNFLYWISQTFGKGIARHFMIPYNTKFWTVPPEELTCEWLDGFIPVPSLDQIVEGTIKESKRQFGYNAQFWYPREGGIGQLSLALASQIKHIYTDCRITEINLAKKEIKMASGNRESYDCLITTIALPEMQYLIKNLSADIRSAFKKLKWNSVFNLNLGMAKNNSDGQHWIYFPQKEICFFRVGFFHNFSPNLAPADKDSLYIEVSYPQDKPVDKSDITFRIKDDLKKAGIIREDNQICREDINDIKYGYPIYDKNYSLVRSKILGFLLKNNIISCGRYGSWRYMSMEDALLDGKSVAESYSF